MISKRYDLDSVGGNVFSVETFTKFLKENVRPYTEYYLILKLVNDKGHIFM